MSNFDQISQGQVHLSTPSVCLCSISKNPLQDSSRTLSLDSVIEYLRLLQNGQPPKSVSSKKLTNFWSLFRSRYRERVFIISFYKWLKKLALKSAWSNRPPWLDMGRIWRSQVNYSGSSTCCVLIRILRFLIFKCFNFTISSARGELNELTINLNRKIQLYLHCAFLVMFVTFFNLLGFDRTFENF